MIRNPKLLYKSRMLSHMVLRSDSGKVTPLTLGLHAFACLQLVEGGSFQSQLNDALAELR